jgi:4-amino-4-deoxy-L-arabinose transferase-like glycosyltransferase
VFYTFSNSQLATYLIPTLPPLAILTGKYFADVWQQKRSRTLDICFSLVALINIACAIAVFVFVAYFKRQPSSLDNINFYQIGGILLLGGLATAIIYFRTNASKGFFALLISTALFFMSTTPIITIMNQHSIKPLIMLLKSKLRPEDEVVSLNYYYQDLPFYLNRLVTVANYQGELEFGAAHTKGANNWIIDTQTLTKRWLTGKKMFMIAGQEDYNKLKQQKIPMYVIGAYLRTILLTNQQ